VIEDAAEAHGAEYRMPDGQWRRCGSFGVLSAFSFYANKLVTTGEGGMVLCDDDEMAERLRRLRNLAFLPGRRFLHEELGFNFRLTNLQAAIGVAQVDRVEDVVLRKRAIAARYTERLSGNDGLQTPSEASWARSVYWMYGITLDPSAGRTAADLAARLHDAGVETRPFFLGMHRQPALRARGLFTGEDYPVADRLAEYGLYLPSGVGLTDDQVDIVCDAVLANVR
jgi:perosamine synthetase